MARTGKKNQALITGRIAYGHDGTDAYPMNADTGGRQKIRLVDSGGTDISETALHTIKLSQREPFIFRPGAAALANGMVAAGSRSGAGTISTAGTANQTYWGTEVVYQPARAGKIDGIAASGVVWGQITLGLKTAAATADAKVTARVRNASGTWTTCLALSGTAIALTTAEIYRTYDIPYLFTTATFNAVPFGVAIGVETSLAGTATIARMMESSYIAGEFEPGT